MKVAFKNDVITNPETGVKRQIVTRSTLPCDAKDLGIGLGLVGAGILWLLNKTFEHGAWSYCDSQFNTLKDLGLITMTEDGKPAIHDNKRGEDE